MVEFFLYWMMWITGLSLIVGTMWAIANINPQVRIRREHLARYFTYNNVIHQHTDYIDVEVVDED